MLRRSTCGLLGLLGLVATLATTASASSDVSLVTVVRCPTTYGVDQPPPRLPSRVSVSASRRATGGLRAYSNGVLLLLAPSGWQCHAVVSADGSANMTVAATATARVAEPAITARFADTPGTAAALACSLIRAAARELPSGVPCPTRAPRREVVTTVNADTVEFTDPPRVRGDGSPSGGGDPARGLIVFLAASGGFTGYAFTATCALPAAEVATCRTVLGDALTRIPADE
jgi:hypothetical protein